MTKEANPGLRRRNAGVVRNGILLLPVKEQGTVVTTEAVNSLRDGLVNTRTGKANAPAAGLEDYPGNNGLQRAEHCESTAARR